MRSLVPVVPMPVELTHDEQRMKWRRSLTELVIRELASDYQRGLVDECTTDAWLEYQRRGLGVTSNRPARRKA